MPFLFCNSISILLDERKAISNPEKRAEKIIVDIIITVNAINSIDSDCFAFRLLRGLFCAAKT